MDYFVLSYIVHQLILFFRSPLGTKNNMGFDGLSKLATFAKNYGNLQTRLYQKGDYMKMNSDYF